MVVNHIKHIQLIPSNGYTSGCSSLDTKSVIVVSTGNDHSTRVSSGSILQRTFKANFTLFSMSSALLSMISLSIAFGSGARNSFTMST
ncbi:hypothetical protein Syun_030674 [Stephania yunnanensis]|uniref:Uncharacterized protein n=1 Tax=Stephania yunnanensis TaxID=152371 RepID=A0AAP0DUF2_9MAGN